MSSKLVKKGLDFVSPANGSMLEKRRNSQKKKRKSRKREPDASYQGLSTDNRKGKIQKRDDFTEQNLKYLKHSAWSIKKDTYEKIVQHQEKKSKKEENPCTEEVEDEDLY